MTLATWGLGVWGVWLTWSHFWPQSVLDGRIAWDETKPDGQPRRSVDAGRAREAFGFEAATDFREGLRRTIEWYEANRAEAERRRS